MAGFLGSFAAKEGLLFDPNNDKGYVALESRMFILDDILDGLRNHNIYMIGLYGISGIGKTTLAIEVVMQVKIEKIFDKAIFVRVSSTPNIKMIQEEIADQLDLELGEGAESERARSLCHRLMKVEKILVVLDDIWANLDLETVGIPFGRVHRGCKILLTSRSRDALVRGMHSQYNHCISVLNQEESWSLFTKMVGDCIKERDLRSIANQVAKECGGLPIAVVTVARALRNMSSMVEWKYALRQLKLLIEGNNALQELKNALQESRSSTGDCKRSDMLVHSSTELSYKGSDALVHSCIELSYDYLIDREVKSAFLVCGLMKRPYNAPIMDLLKYGMGLGLFEGTYSMQERRDRVYALVHKLKVSFLLLDGHTKDLFSMHDIVHNLAISIATRDQHAFSVRNTVPKGWLKKDILKNCTAVSLHDINIEELRQGLEFPELKFFCMNPKDPFFKIPDNFFIGMTKLTALVLTKMQLLSLPSSLHLLQNLETLCLDECVLGDVAIIGNLKKLEILSLHCSDIERLPREIGQLTQLKFLDLSNCSKLEVIPQNVLSSLSQLEELYTGNTSVEWELEGLNTRSTASLLELEHLSQLTTLEIHIRNAVILPKGLFSKKLVRYKIFIGDEWDWSDKYENSRMLKLQLHTTICLDDVIMLLKGIEELYLDEVPGIKNVLYDLDKEGFPQLKHLHVQNNPFISYVVDSPVRLHCDAFPLLESLVLHNLICLEKICYGQLTAKSLHDLKIIKVRNCHKLKDIFSLSIARGLPPQLQTIEVIKCKNVEEIFSVGRENNVDSVELDELEFGELRSLTLKFLPQLTGFYSQVKRSAKSQKRHKDLTIHNTPMAFFNSKVVFPNLETLELCAISVEALWHNQPAAVSPCFQNLKRLIVHSCDKLKYLFTSSIVSNFAQLQHLEICYCSTLEEIVAKERGADSTAKFSFPRVTSLKLCNLSELRTFYPGLYTAEWPSLKKLEVNGCDRVEIFSSEFHSFQESSKEGQLDIPVQRALFFVKEVPSLEELKLNGKDITMMCQGQLWKHLFGNLKILEVLNDKSEKFPIGLLQRFHNLEKLELRRSSYKEIFSYAEFEKHAGMLTQIKSLKLWELSDLMCLWKQNSKLDSVVQSLETLEVWWCDNLINLVPYSASFENLTTLEIWCCKRLRNLVTLSTAKSLVHLMKLRVDGCKLMTEIISNEGDAAEDEFVFSKLKWLSLERLENLTSFCSANYSFKFPSLEDVFVIECPKMEIFSRKVISTPRLQEVRQKWGLDKGCWKGDLNTTIQQLYKEKSLSQVSLTDSPSSSLAEATATTKPTAADNPFPSIFCSQMTKETFPPGVRFSPSDQELVLHYLIGKVRGRTDGAGSHFIKEIELYEYEPSELSSLAYDSGDDKMYFFTRPKLKYQGGKKINRRTRGGFWKITGRASYIKDTDGKPVASKTILIYCMNNHKTQWVMEEYVLLPGETPNQDSQDDENSEMLSPWTLCVVYGNPVERG